MCSDEGVKDRVVDNAEASNVVGKVVVSRLIVRIPFHAATSYYNPFGR